MADKLPPIPLGSMHNPKRPLGEEKAKIVAYAKEEILGPAIAEELLSTGDLCPSVIAGWTEADVFYTRRFVSARREVDGVWVGVTWKEIRSALHAAQEPEQLGLLQEGEVA
jgi:hypothetical protein